MKTLARVLALVLCLTGAVFSQGPLLPLLPPLLQIYEGVVKNPAMNQLSYDEKRPLLTVREIVQMHLARDDKGVLLVLKEDDAKSFAAITREYEGRILMFKAVDGTVRPVTIHTPVEDGRVAFKYPEAEALAEDYRRHFHLGEFGQKAP